MKNEDQIVVEDHNAKELNRIYEILLKFDCYQIMKECEIREIDLVLQFLEKKRLIFEGLRNVKVNM